MKKNLIVVFILFSVPVVSFAQNTIEGAWIVDVEKSIQLMEDKIRTKYDSLPAHVKQRGKDTMRDREFRFEKNGKVTVNWRMNYTAKQSNGSWKIDSANKKLILSIDGRTFDYSYEMPSVSTLILRSEDTGGFFDTLFFNKSSH